MQLSQSHTPPHMQDNAYVTGYLICGKPYEEVICETAADYLHQTAEPHETLRERILKRRVFQDGLQCGVFFSVPRGVPQVAACHGQLYDITCENVHNRKIGRYLDLFQDKGNN